MNYITITEKTSLKDFFVNNIRNFYLDLINIDDSSLIEEFASLPKGGYELSKLNNNYYAIRWLAINRNSNKVYFISMLNNTSNVEIIPLN